MHNRVQKECISKGVKIWKQGFQEIIFGIQLHNVLAIKQKCKGVTDHCKKKEVTPETTLQKGGFQKASGKQEDGESRILSSLGAFIFSGL